MKRWSTKPLGAVCKLINGRAFKPHEWQDAGLPIIRIQNLNDPTKPFNYTTQMLPEKFRVKRGDTLLSWSGTPGTSFGCFRWDGPEGWLNQHIFNVRLSDEVLPPFFIHQVNSKLDELIRKAHGGVGLQHITKGTLSSIKVAVPPLEEQGRIMNLLDEADELRGLRNQADRQTADLIPALFHEMFGDPTENSQAWPTAPVSSLVEDLQGGRNVKPAGAAEATGRYRVLKVSAVTWGEFRPDESKPVPSEYDPPQAHFVRVGDLLFSRANTTELVAATSYVFETAPNLLLPDKLWRFVWKEPRAVEPLFIWWLFQAPNVRRELARRATGTGGSMKNISKPKVLTLRVPVPPLPLQNEFARRVSEIRSLRAEQAASRERIDALFESMLHRAFQGEL